MDESQTEELGIDAVSVGDTDDQGVTGPLPDEDPLDGDRPIERLELDEIIGGDGGTAGKKESEDKVNE